MREIKFRVWDADSKSLIYNPLAFPELYFLNELEQFTGMKDINGTNIYEGDIIRSRVNMFYPKQGVQERPVIFEDGAFKCGCVDLKTVMFFEPEVIGNIHEVTL